MDPIPSTRQFSLSLGVLIELTAALIFERRISRKGFDQSEVQRPRELDSSSWKPPCASPRVSAPRVFFYFLLSPPLLLRIYWRPASSQPRRITVSCVAGMRRYICCRLL